MSTSLKRTSMALDEETLEGLDQLSKNWNVSKAEVMRRSVALARRDSEDRKQRKLEALRWLGKNGLTPKQVADFRAEVEAERKAWPDSWADYEAKFGKLEKNRS